MFHSYTFNFRSFIFLNVISALFIGLIIDYLFLSLIILKTDTLPAYKYFRMIKENNINEIPIFGSSRANGSYVPSIIGQDVFNYGMDGSGFGSILFLLEKELEKNKKSDIIINYDLGSILFTKEAAYKIIPLYSSAKDLVESKNIFFNIPFLRFFGYYFYYLRFYLRTKINLTKIHDNGGLFEIQNKPMNDFLRDVEMRKKTKIHINHDQEAVNKLFELLLKSERKIWFVIAPYHSSNFDAMTENTKSEVNKIIRNLNLLENVEVLDFARIFDQKDEYFFDTTHITYDGAKEFSKILKLRLNL